MKDKFKKILSIIALLILLFGRTFPVYAQEVSAQPSPTPSTEQTTNTTDTSQQSSWRDHDWDDDDEDEDDDDEDDEDDRAGDGDETPDDDNSVHNVPSPSPSPLAITNQAAGEETGNADANNQVGDTLLTTGDANTTGNIANTGNLNAVASDPSGSGDGSLNIINSENGADSSNTGSATITQDNTTDQSNSATVLNNLDLESDTGGNEADRNVGNTEIETGDANVTGTIVNNVNTNIAGVAISEFNIEDVHTGDLVLDFASNCIAGCGIFDTSLANIGNGADSDNDLSLDSTTNNTTNQINDITALNNMTLDADSGHNSASRNTGGDSTITAGDANVSANALTFANNNLAGNVLYGVVNIFGDLIGDIILDEATLASLGVCVSCPSDVTAKNVGNGSNSDNNIAIDTTNNDNTFQFNDATIENNLIMEAETGNNDVSKNTGGDNSIKTGNADVDAQVLNIANSNIIGGIWWLVIVNEAGQWVGRIMGAPDGTNFAGSSGTEFSVDGSGEITATNSGNGSGSDNNIDVAQTTNNTTNQINTANIVNNLNLSANTGGNEASRNTGGNSSIITGDAKIVANLVNFVNNNISGGKLVVTVVNVFGSWLGDFVGPGQQKQNNNSEQEQQVLAQGSSEGNPSDEQQNNNNSQTQGNSQTQAPSSTPQVLAASLQGPSLPGSTGFGGVGAAVAVSNFSAVAGFKAGSENPVSTLLGGEKSKIRINIAWLLLLVPPIVGLGIIKNRKLLSKFL